MKMLIHILAVIVSVANLRAQSPMPNMRVNHDPPGTQQGGARIALDRNGTLYVVWTDFRSNSNGDIYLSTSTDGGATFSPDKAVYTGGAVPSGLERGVTMAIDSMGGIHMVWMEAKRSAVPELRYIRSVDGGATFSQPVYIGGPAGISAQDFPSMGIDANNNLYVAWVDDRELRNGTGTNTQIYFTRSADRGVTFSAPVRASIMPGGTGGSCECCNTSMAVTPGGHIYITFRSNINNRRDVFVARSLNRGESFDTAMPAASERWMIDACPMSGSAIVLDSQETAHIVWRDARPSAQGKDYIYHAMLFYGATACTPDIRIATPLSQNNFPSIGITRQGAIVCSFQGNRNNVSDIVSVSSLDGGNSFTAAANLSDDPGSASRLEPISVIGADGTRYTVWRDARRDAGDIYFTRDNRPLALVAPERVSLLAPANALVGPAYEKFSWTPPSNLADARNVAYDLTILKKGAPTVVRGIRATEYISIFDPGSYAWSVVAYTPVGRSEPSATFSFTVAANAGVDAGNAAPGELLMLGDVFPNPAHDELRVPFVLGRPGAVAFSVIGLDGTQRLALDAHMYDAGEQSTTLDIRSLTSGVYILDVRASGTSRRVAFTVVR